MGIGDGLMCLFDGMWHFLHERGHSCRENTFLFLTIMIVRGTIMPTTTTIAPIVKETPVGAEDAIAGWGRGGRDGVGGS